MVARPDTEWLTIAEAAKLLKVSRITVYRWLRDGRLPSYHAGPRTVRIRRDDVDTVLQPAKTHRNASPTTNEDRSQLIHSTLDTIQPLTEEEKQRAFAAMEQARQLGDRIRARLGDQPFEESWPIIREAREERSRQLL